MKAMFVAQVKGLAIVLLALGIVAGSAGMLTHWALAEKQITAQPPFEIALRADADEEALPKKQAPEREQDEPLPTGALARLGRLRFQHGEGIRSLAFSPDGTLLASAGHDLDPNKDAGNHTICIWDVRTGKEVGRLQGNAGNFWSLAFAPDGKILAASATGTEQSVLILWEVAGGKQLRQIRGPRGNNPDVPVPVAFAPDGKTLAFTGEDRVLRLWETATGKEVRRLPCKKQDQACSLAFSPDGKRLAAGSWNGDVFRWETAGGKALQTWQHVSRFHIDTLGFSANGKYLAIAGETLRLWEADTGKEFLAFDKSLPRQHCAALAFSPSASTLALLHWSGGEQSIQMWNLAPGGGNILTIRLSLQAMPPQRNYLSSPPSLQFSPDGKLLALATGKDGAIRLWDVAGGQERIPLAGVRALTYLQWGKTLVWAGADGRVRFGDVATRAESRSFPTNSAVTALASSHNGKLLATVGEDNTVSLWQTADGTRSHRIRQIDPGWEKIDPPKRNAADPVAALAFSSDDTTLSVVTSRTSGNIRGSWTDIRLGLWDTATGKATRLANPLPPGRKGGLRAGFRCAFSADAKMLDGWLDGQRFFVDMASGKGGRMGDELKADRPRVVAVSPDGKLSATGIWSPAPEGKFSKKSIIQLWGAARQDLPKHPGFLTAMAFSPDGKTLASAAWNVHDPGTTLWLWDVTTRKEIRRWSGHRGRVNALAFSPDGKRLSSASSDGTVLVWKVE